jgi:hypothetical protein
MDQWNYEFMYVCMYVCMSYIYIEPHLRDLQPTAIFQKHGAPLHKANMVCYFVQ